MGQVLASVVQESGVTSILELAAGSGEASAELAKEVQQRVGAIPYVICDKFPDIAAFSRISVTTEGAL